MTNYYFKAKVSIKDTPPDPWKIEDTEVVVSFTDKTWWAFSEQTIDEGENVQQLYKNWLMKLEHHCVIEETLPPIKVKASQVAAGMANKTIGGVGLKFKIFIAISAAALIFILIIALRPIPTYTEGNKQGSTTKVPATTDDKRTSTGSGQESRSLIIGQYAQVYMDVDNILPSYMVLNSLRPGIATVPNSAGSFYEFELIFYDNDADSRGLKYAVMLMKKKFILVENGTSVQITGRVKENCYKVKIVGGSHTGLVGYLPQEYLR
jgi:hypothetical protein